MRRPHCSTLPAAGLVGALALALLVGGTALGASEKPGAPPGQPSGSPTPVSGVGHLDENPTTGMIVGSYVSFFVGDKGTVLENYSSEGLLILARVEVPGYQLENKTFHDSNVQVDGNRAGLQVHDTPGATLALSLQPPAKATFALAEGATATAGADGRLLVSIMDSERVADVWTSCGEGTVLLSGDGMSFSVEGNQTCSVHMRVHAWSSPTESLVADSAESGDLAAEIYLGGAPWQGGDVTPFADVEVIIGHAGDRTVISVESLEKRPSCVLIWLAPPPPDAHFEVIIDGQAASPADDLQDALDPWDDGGASEYHLDTEVAPPLLVVSMPRPAAYVIEVRAVEDPARGPPSDAALGAAAGFAVVAVAAAALVRRR